MRHVCAYLLAAMGSNAANAANMKAILASVGVEADDKQLELVIQKFGNKNIEKVIAEGSAFLAAMGGGGGGAVAASGSAPAGGGDAPKAEEKKEEKKEESEESDDDMGFGLFD